MDHVSKVLGKLVSEPQEPIGDDAREAIHEGLDAQDDDQGLPLGWEAVEIVEP